MSITPSSQPSTPLRSIYADDPEMAELVQLFVEEMPERTARLRHAVDAEDLASLTRLAHQLKGAAAGYGFPVIGERAGTIEDRCKSLDAAGGVPAELAGEVTAFIELCSTASARAA